MTSTSLQCKNQAIKIICRKILVKRKCTLWVSRDSLKKKKKMLMLRNWQFLMLRSFITLYVLYLICLTYIKRSWKSNINTHVYISCRSLSSSLFPSPLSFFFYSFKYIHLFDDVHNLCNSCSEQSFEKGGREFFGGYFGCVCVVIPSICRQQSSNNNSDKHISVSILCGVWRAIYLP